MLIHESVDHPFDTPLLESSRHFPLNAILTGAFAYWPFLQTAVAAAIVALS